VSAEQAGNNRRLSEDEERRGADLFAEGKSEREVADELGCSPSTAHRLHERLQQAGSGGSSGLAVGDLIPMRLLPGGRVEITDPAEGLAEEVEGALRVELLEQLGQRRAEFAEAVASCHARAAASRQAIAALDAERLELLAAGQDAAPLRQRRADAEADLADWEKSAELAAGPVAQADMRIAEVRAEQAQAEAEAARKRAAQQGDRLAPLAAAALRDAVTGDIAVRALASLGGQLARAEQASGQSWEAVIVPPALPGNPRDDWHRMVYGLWRAALTGDVAACQAIVPRCQPWQDRAPEQIAALRADVERHAEQTREQAALLSNGRMQGGLMYAPELPNPIPGAVRSARTGW
jgi:hypothetical protein